MDRLPVRRAALPYLVDLANRVVGDRPWVVALAIPIGLHAVLVDRIWTAHAPLDSILDVGTRMPMIGSAHGRAMLSTYPQDEVQRLLGGQDHATLRDQLARSREYGHAAASSNEFRPGISAIAAAIVSAGGTAAGSVAVSGVGLEDELSLDSQIAQHLRRTADAIAHALLPGSR